MMPNVTSDDSEDKTVLSDDPITHSNCSDSESDDECTSLTYQEYKCLDIQKMSDDEKSILCGQFTAEYRDITNRFSRLNRKIRKSLKSRNITPQQLAEVLMEVSAFSLLNCKQKTVSLLEEQFEEIDEAENIRAVFKILCPYGSFFDCHVLKRIVHSELCLESDRNLLKEYLSKLTEYCQRSIFKCPRYSKQGDNQVFQSLVMKVDDSMLTVYNLKALDAFRNRLAAVLKLENHTLPIRSVESGCLLLVFQIPRFVEGHIFPLSCKQKRDLKDNGVKCLKNGEGQVYFDADQEVS